MTTSLSSPDGDDDKLHGEGAALRSIDRRLRSVQAMMCAHVFIFFLACAGVSAAVFMNLGDIAEIKQYVKDIKNTEALRPASINTALSDVYATVKNARDLSYASVPAAQRAFAGLNDSATTDATRRVAESIAGVPKDHLARATASATTLMDAVAGVLTRVNVTEMVRTVTGDANIQTALRNARDFAGAFLARATRFEKVVSVIVKDIHEL